MATKKSAANKSQATTSQNPIASQNIKPKTKKNPKQKPSKKDHKTKKIKQPRTTKQKMVLVALILVVILLVSAAIAALVLLLTHKDKINQAERAEYEDPIYSILTGEEIANEELNSSPTYCVQMPNGSTDGARPQAGLSQAGVVFEAIAERGITRFAAVYQNATVGAIGPIRSLRSYYLDWDTPFDCTVVRSGGSDEALADINYGGQRNLDESLEYMWREDSDRYWNNLFTSPIDLAKFNSTMGYNTSNVKAFSRYTPDENDEILSQIKTCDTEIADNEDIECIPTEIVGEVSIGFGPIPAYNTVYYYDLKTNSYLRSYADGTPHLTYNCPGDLDKPNTKTACGDPVQVAPRAVVAMFVQESTASDGYHENINTISSGSALVFQNGGVIEATWSKTAQDSQIVFRNGAGEEVKFTPGQLWIAAVPQYGSVDY